MMKKTITSCIRRSQLMALGSNSRARSGLSGNIAAAPSPRPELETIRTGSIIGDIVGNVGCALGQAATHQVGQLLKLLLALAFLLIIVGPPLLAHDLGRTHGFRAGMRAAGRNPLGDPDGRR